jgi:hypothetical protein
MSRKQRPGRVAPRAGSSEVPNDNASFFTPSSDKSLAVESATELSRKVDKELDADRRFFKRWPERRHYIRRVFPNERAQMEQQARALGDQFPPATFDPHKQGVFVGVKKIRHNARVRVTFIATRDIETDLSEAEAQEIFGWLSSPKVEQIIAGFKAMGP